MINRKILLVLSFILAVTASSSLWALQFARPDATTAAAGWTAVNAATHHEALDEVTADDNNYIDSGNANNSTVILGLSNVADPGTYANNHILRFHCQSAGNGGPERCNAELFDGGTSIFSTGNNSANRGAFALYEFTIPDASTITDYSNLSIQLTSASLGGSESIQISWVELEVPDSAATPATVTSPTSTAVTDTTATLGGTMTVDGSPTVTDCGVEWGTTPGGPYPNSVSDGICTVSVPFTVGVTGLPASSTIYFRAWATNGVAAFSTEASFTTNAPASPPTVDTPTFASVTENSAVLGGTVSADGGATVTDRGIVWNTTSPAETGGTGVSMGSGLGSFSNTVGSLPPGTLIFFKAYATNSAGTSYSTESSFTTSAPASPPTVDTPTFASVTANSAVLGGTVSANGGATVTDRGIVWNTTSPAETGGTGISMGSGLGSFSKTVGSLPAGTLIFFKAYAINSAGTSYSTESSFTTLAGLPTVDTPTVAAITATTADLGGNVALDGGAAVTARGIVWDTVSSPEIAGTVVPMGSGLGSFSNTVGSLPTGVLVYFRAYATNTAGTAYSAVASFTPAGPPVVDTPTVTSITLNTADLGGNVSSDGGTNVLSHGIVWDTASPPEAAGTVVVMGSGTGTFSQTVSGLPTGTLIYFKAYATNASSTAYSAPVSSFTTLSEPTVQASNILFPRVAERSMRITWTRGNGDGSIVVLRQDPPDARTDPADGDDYAANADYTLAPEIPVNSGNFVVYKGPDSSVTVRGLTGTTTYSVAIYEYGRSGANPDYLLAPAEASQATNSVPVHNLDNGADCTDCHNHGAFITRDTELKTVCETCHNPSGVASAKLEFDNHLTPGKNPAVDFVDCGVCHEMHNPGGPNTIESTHSISLLTQNNKSFLRANVDKYISTASPPAYLHTDTPRRDTPHPDAPQTADTPDRAVEGGNDSTARGYCQVCHTLTNYHRSSDTAGANQCHDGVSNDSCGPAETNCGECHQHNNKFIGVGGSTTCVLCHDSQQGGIPRPIITTQYDRLSSHITGGSGVVTQDDCLVCHDQGGHQAQTVRLWDVDDGATSFAQLTAAAPTTNTGEGEQFEGNCLSCHDDGSGDSLPGSGDQTPTSPFTGSGAPPVIDTTAWASASHNRPVATSGSSPVTCIGDGTNGCHGSGHGSEQLSLLAPASGAAISPTAFCYVCHDADGPSSIDIEAEFTSATNYTATGNDGATVDQRHNVDTSAVNCKDCHAPHVNNTANPVADPDTNLALATYSTANSYTDDGHNFAYDGGGNLDPTNPEGSAGGFTEPDYIQFCLACHDGTAPAGVTMPALENIATSFAGKQHGAAEGSSGSRAGKGNLKVPWTTAADYAAGNDPSAPYAALNCTTCHGPHGSDNIFNLRSSINVAGVQMQIGGQAGSQFDSFSGTTYTLPTINSGSQVRLEWGAWCSFCHNMNAHAGVDETTTCNTGHVHGGNNF